MRKTIDEATARRLAVKADCDPRTVRKVLQGDPLKSMSARRAHKVLVEEGLAEPAQNAL